MSTSESNQLAWFVGSNGNYFADHDSKRYCCWYNGNDKWTLAVNGTDIFPEISLTLAKAAAHKHAFE